MRKQSDPLYDVSHDNKTESYKSHSNERVEGWKNSDQSDSFENSNASEEEG